MRRKLFLLSLLLLAALLILETEACQKETPDEGILPETMAQQQKDPMPSAQRSYTPLSAQAQAQVAALCELTQIHGGMSPEALAVAESQYYYQAYKYGIRPSSGYVSAAEAPFPGYSPHPNSQVMASNCFYANYFPDQAAYDSPYTYYWMFVDDYNARTRAFGEISNNGNLATHGIGATLPDQHSLYIELVDNLSYNGSHDLGQSLRFCDNGAVLLKLDRNDWNTGTLFQRMNTIYHELGHDLLSLPHVERTNDIMNAFDQPGQEDTAAHFLPVLTSFFENVADSCRYPNLCLGYWPNVYGHGNVLHGITNSEGYMEFTNVSWSHTPGQLFYVYFDDCHPREDGHNFQTLVSHDWTRIGWQATRNDRTSILTKEQIPGGDRMSAHQALAYAYQQLHSTYQSPF